MSVLIEILQKKGGTMKMIVRHLCIISLLLAVIIISGCAAPLQIQYVPMENPDNHLASIPPLMIKLSYLVDKRESTEQATLVGEKLTGTNVGREDVTSEESVFEIIREAMKSELTRSGHTVTDINDDINMKGELKHFWLKTDINSENGVDVDSWDVIAEIKILLEIENIRSGKSAIFGPYYAKNSERRYLAPNNEVMERVFEGSLSKLIKSVSSDTELASALKK
jgi:uncharacterized lipoprotein YajG